MADLTKPIEKHKPTEPANVAVKASDLEEGRRVQERAARAAADHGEHSVADLGARARFELREDDSRDAPPWRNIPRDAAARPIAALGRVVATMPVYVNDDPQDVLLRARAVLAGDIPIEKAARVRAEALLKTSKLDGTRRPDITVGTEFEASEIPVEDLRRFYMSGAITVVG